jgi:RNA polymerase sigma-70 factor (ECF subfamily)
MTDGINRPAAGEAEDLLREVAVAEALRAISVAHREVLNETILRSRTVNEAAATLGIPVRTVKSRVYYALRALRLVLAERATAEPACHAPADAVRRAMLEKIRDS